MDSVIHLPLIALNRQHWSLRGLLEYTEIAESPCFRALSVNNHLLFTRPWLDGPTALAGYSPARGRCL